MENLMTKDLEKQIVAKHDHLIRANYKLTVNQQRLILNLIAQIHPEDTEFKRYSFKISDLCRLLKLDKKSIIERRRSFQKVLNGLQRNLLEIVFYSEGRDVLRTPAWIEEPEFDWEMDEITLRVSETLKPYLLQLKERGRFASYRLQDISNFRCEYSFRLLEFCRNFEPRADFHDLVVNNRYVKRVVYSLSELKKTLGIPPGQYRRPYDFQKKVLSRAQSEIHRHTASYFEFEFLKVGREVTGVELSIFGGAIAVPKIVLSESQKLRVDRAKGLGCSWNFATKIVVEYEHKPDQVWQAIMAVEEYGEWLTARNQKLRFPASALKKALFEGWHSRKWQAQMERELEEEIRRAREEERAALKKTLAKLTARRKNEAKLQEEQWQFEDDRQNRKFEEKLKGWAAEYARLEPEKRMKFMLGVLPDGILDDLSEEQRHKTEKMVDKFTKSPDYGFREVYNLSFHLVLEYIAPFARA
jgi:plasmid replication initiation protein